MCYAAGVGVRMSGEQWKKLWLLGFVILVLAMISVGGVTRLTRSGLSIVEWRPVTGILPPITEQDWQEQFQLYQNSPEYNQVNSHFELQDYKRIFFWEYFHRLLGRLIFLFVVIPGLILWKRKWISGPLVLLLSFLVAFQGLIGWLMVRSGLNLLPRVSPYMLALHFSLALIVLGTGYFHLTKSRSEIRVEDSKWKRILLKALGFIMIVQIFYGCLTSGLKAGHASNTYPLMGGQFFPPGGLLLQPLWINLFENPITVQWIHRWIGILFFTLTAATFWTFTKSPAVKKGPFRHMMGVTGVQVILGILNIIWGVPIALAALHQLVAALIFLGFLNLVFRVRFTKLRL